MADPDKAALADVRLSPLERDWLNEDVVTRDGVGRVVGVAPDGTAPGSSRAAVWVSDGTACWAVAVADLRKPGPEQPTLENT